MRFVYNNKHSSTQKTNCRSFALNGPRRRREMRRWIAIFWRRRWSNLHSMYLPFELLMHVFDEVALLLGNASRFDGGNGGGINNSIHFQLVVVPVSSFVLLLVVRRERVEIRIGWRRRLRRQILLVLNDCTEFLN